MTKKETSTITWRAAEYEYAGKRASWYFIIIGATAVLTISALWQHNFFFAVFVLIAGTMLIVLGKKRPRVVNFTINEKGVGIGKYQFYDYDDLEGFDIHERPHRLDEILLKRKTTFNPFVKMPIDSKNAPKARVILTSYLEETEYNESLIDILADWLGF